MAVDDDDDNDADCFDDSSSAVACFHDSAGCGSGLDLAGVTLNYMNEKKIDSISMRL